MAKRLLIFFVCAGLACPRLRAQELQANITVLATRVGTNVDHKIFQTLQSGLYDFLNTRKWSNENFQANEKIICNFLINISQAADNNSYQASLTVQASRPVFNSSYQSPLINFIDQSFVFRYVEYQPLDFSDSRVQGTDPLTANLTATLAYYVYLILGLDFDSYSQRGGDAYYQKALNIVNNAPDSREISGWKAFDGLRNRYWLIENLTNSKYNLIHDAFYGYYRSGMDQLYDKDAEARKAFLNVLNLLNTINTDNPNSMILQFFFESKANELSKIFKNSPPDEKEQALDLLTRMDITNVNKYKQDLQ
ncbi:MAG: DUF4835 family protein [Puia sp.]|nr:DUF4835 family protein [Puia sp.]